jgi:phosphate/sulfate permease
MKRFMLVRLESLITCAIAALFMNAPSVAHACPMCFSTGENDGAFIYGSIFLMVVPVLSLGGLGYWAYRRLKAIDDGVNRHDRHDRHSVDASEAPQDARENGSAVVLQISQPR